MTLEIFLTSSTFKYPRKILLKGIPVRIEISCLQIEDASLSPQEKHPTGFLFFIATLLTILMAKENLPKHVTLGLDTLGVRISGDKKLREFITRVGVPLLVPSANKSSCPPLDNSKDVYEVFKGEIPYIVDDICSKGLPSTIVDISKNDIRLVRQGDISFETIKEYYKECTK